MGQILEAMGSVLEALGMGSSQRERGLVFEVQFHCTDAV